MTMQTCSPKRMTALVEQEAMMLLSLALVHSTLLTDGAQAEWMGMQALAC